MSILKCNHCNTLLVSIGRHDFLSCNCEDHEKRVFNDGGVYYSRRSFGQERDTTDFTEVVHIALEDGTDMEDFLSGLNVKGYRKHPKEPDVDLLWAHKERFEKVNKNRSIPFE